MDTLTLNEKIRNLVRPVPASELIPTFVSYSGIIGFKQYMKNKKSRKEKEEFLKTNYRPFKPFRGVNE